MTARDRWYLARRLDRIARRAGPPGTPDRLRWFALWCEVAARDPACPNSIEARATLATIRAARRDPVEYVGDYSIQWGACPCPGWYYWHTDYPEEGSEGPIISLESARRWVERETRAARDAD